MEVFLTNYTLFFSIHREINGAAIRFVNFYVRPIKYISLLTITRSYLGRYRSFWNCLHEEEKQIPQHQSKTFVPPKIVLWGNKRNNVIQEQFNRNCMIFIIEKKLIKSLMMKLHLKKNLLWTWMLVISKLKCLAASRL